VSFLAIVAGLCLAQSASAVPTGEPALTTSTPADSVVFQDVTCEGSVAEVDQSQPEPEPEPIPTGVSGPTGPTGPTDEEPEEEEPPYIVENYYEYSFTCDKDVWAYTIVTNRDVATFDSETLGFTSPTNESPKGDPAPGEDFFCIGSIPSFGPACYGAVRGTPARQTKISAGNTGRGNMVLDVPICEAYDQPQAWVVVMTELGSYNDTVSPVRVTGPWIVTSDPIPLDTSEVDCDEPLLLKEDVETAATRPRRPRARRPPRGPVPSARRPPRPPGGSRPDRLTSSTRRRSWSSGREQIPAAGQAFRKKKKKRTRRNRTDEDQEDTPRPPAWSGRPVGAPRHGSGRDDHDQRIDHGRPAGNPARQGLRPGRR
jgi:hypothetical protein